MSEAPIDLRPDPTPAPPRPEVPAFPEQNIIAHGDMMKATTTPGMTLRQWFAGQALVGILAGRMKPIEDLRARDIAHDADTLANAMMKQCGNYSENPNGSEGVE